MTTARERHNRMYAMYGVDTQHRKCEECFNFKRNDRGYGKCKVYGDTACEATDWSGKADACGFIDCVHVGQTVVEMYKHMPKPKEEEEQLEGQMSIEDFIYDESGEND